MATVQEILKKNQSRYTANMQKVPSGMTQAEKDRATAGNYGKPDPGFVQNYSFDAKKAPGRADTRFREQYNAINWSWRNMAKDSSVATQWLGLYDAANDYVQKRNTAYQTPAGQARDAADYQALLARQAYAKTAADFTRMSEQYDAIATSANRDPVLAALGELEKQYRQRDTAKPGGLDRSSFADLARGGTYTGEDVDFSPISEGIRELAAKRDSYTDSDVWALEEQLRPYLDVSKAGTDIYTRARGYMDILESLEKRDGVGAYAAYTAGQIGLGALSSSDVTPLFTPILDIVSGGEYADGYKVLDEYLQAHPVRAKAAYAGQSHDYVIQQLANDSGVDADIVKNYLQSNRINALTQENNDYFRGVSAGYKENVGQLAYSLGQQIPGMGISAAMGPVSAAASEGGGFIGSLMNGEGLGNAAKAALQGNIATYMIGANVAGNTYMELAKERGYDPVNLANALGQGFVEYFTEGLFGFSDADSIQKVFSTATGSGGMNVGKAILNWLMGGLEEGLEEVVNVPLGGMVDDLTTENGKKLFGEGGIFDWKEMLRSGLQGMTMGLILGGVGAISGTVQAYQEAGDIQEAVGRLNRINSTLPAAYQAQTVNARTATAETVDSYAEQVLQGFAAMTEATESAAGGERTGTSLQGGVIDAEDGSGDLLLRAAEEVTQKGRVTNNTAIDILSNPTAITTLTQEAGLNISEDMSKSQQRKAVKSAVETLARAQSDVSANARETAPIATEARQTATQETVRPAMQVEQQRPAAQQAYDIRRVRDAAASLGENGAKALSASYDGSVRADDYYAGFASYYEAGISGIDMSKVQSRYAAQLNQAQRFAAYSAGQNDAAASLALEQEGVKSATVYGDEAGFVQSEHSASLPKETVRFYDSLARAAGVKIQMAEAAGKGGANGWYSNGIIHIANDAENPGTVVAKHEITHRMQEMAPEAYRKYRDYAMSALTERDGSTASIVEQYKSRYAEAGVNLSTEQAMDEIAADFTEALTVDPARFETLAKENRSVARKLLDAVRDFIRKVKSLFKGNKTAQNQAAANAYGVSIDTLEEAARLWEEALKATSEQTANKNAVQTDGDAKFSIKRTREMTLAQQLKLFYDGKMASSDAFYFGETPATLEVAGLDRLPLAFTIADFKKSTQKKHNIPRRVLKSLQHDMETALFAFADGDRMGILTSDIDGDGKPLLVAIQKNVQMDADKVNAIRSVYGLDHPAAWLQNQIDGGKTFYLLDEQRANTTLYPYGYMASRKDGIRSLDGTVTQESGDVKKRFSLKSPVERTDTLIALHNMHEEKLRSTLKLGA